MAQLAKAVGLVSKDPSEQIFKSKVIDEVLFGPVFHRGNLLVDGKTDEILQREDVLKAACLDAPHIVKISSPVGTVISKLFPR